MDIKALQTRLREFAAARDWQPYHAPKNLAMALMVEAAELLELFQWQTLTESRGFTATRPTRSAWPMRLPTCCCTCCNWPTTPMWT
jgi:hypothetical protein